MIGAQAGAATHAVLSRCPRKHQHTDREPAQLKTIRKLSGQHEVSHDARPSGTAGTPRYRTSRAVGRCQQSGRVGGGDTRGRRSANRSSVGAENTPIAELGAMGVLSRSTERGGKRPVVWWGLG